MRNLRYYESAILLGLLTAGLGPAVPATALAQVVRIPIEGVIDKGLVPYVQRSLAAAGESGARLAILDINTPGGRIDAAWAIVDAVQESPVPVYALVDRGLSAGAMIALAAQQIYMRPGGSLGAATPVTGQGEKASEKIVSAMRSEFRALAEARGIDPQIAAAMVDERIAIPGVVEEGQLLTLSAAEAVELGFAGAVVDGFAGALAELDVAGAEVVTTEPNWAELIVRFLTSPVVAPLLLSIGFMGLLFEVKTPGFGFGGIVGLTGLTLFFGAHLLVGLAGWEELLLIGAGLILIALEVFVFPGFGVAGALGILTLGAGVILSMLGRFPTLPDLSLAVTVLLSSLIITGVFAFVLLRHLRWTRSFGGLFLRQATTAELGYVSSDVREDLVGQIGTAGTDLRPAGVGMFGEERIDVVSEGDWIEAGRAIEILRSEGYRHVVREQAPSSAAADPVKKDG